MKIKPLLAAAAIIAGLGVSTAASAQDYRDHERYEHRDRRDYRGDDRRHHGWNGHRNRCHTEFRHHRRVTVCYR